MAKKFDLSSAAGITRAIDSVVRRASSWQGDVQVIALACMQHSRTHGDWTLAARLVNGVSKCDGVKKSALKAYMEAFMRGEFVADKGEMKFRFDEGADSSTIMVEQAQAVNWYAFKPEKPQEALDVNKLLAKLLKSVTTAEEVSVDLTEAAAQIAALQSALKDLQVEAELAGELEEEAA